MNKATDLIIYKKAETLLNEVYPILRAFPKSEKFAICQEIKQAFYALLRNIMLANNIKARKRIYQEEADAYIKLLVVLFSVAKKQRYITQKRHTMIQLKIEELGKILGGWMKSS
ncbi:diversity-generating retroelement protein Avd [Bacillus sp. CGMCC 1.16541]|uniref:diversity-generating retroelement protein Avd n=1 Tax=Bacillus sp. CGMCC 1.16541 TaxID=2185143 RepID=UPI001EF642EF|nr:diversity-generating retroelement protein Avd [Bacillus sp. CGMCC 1.16541]